MIETILKEGKKSGFSTVEVFRVIMEKQEYEKFIDYHATHSVKTDRIIVRAFWDFGDPVGFSLSVPGIESIKSAFFSIGSVTVPDKKENYSELLPCSVEKVKLNIFDGSIHREDNKRFDNLVENIQEILISFPGLSLKKIYFSQNLKKIYVANTRQLNIKYKKTNFNLILKFGLRDNVIDINQTSTCFDNIDPFRMIPRAFNLLNSLTDETGVNKKSRFFIFSPEASVFVLKEFSDQFKLGQQASLKGIQLSSVLNIVDNPLMDEQAGSVPFDDEGVQSGEKYLVRKGIFTHSISNISSAFHNGTLSSGNGFRTERSLFPQVNFSNLFIKPSVISLKKLMIEAGTGILVSLLKLKFVEENNFIFSAYGYHFKDGDIEKPVHFYFKTSFLSYFINIKKVSRETKFFHSYFNLGSPYILIEAKWKTSNMFEI